jgi:hypothetical protein
MKKDKKPAAEMLPGELLRLSGELLQLGGRLSMIAGQHLLAKGVGHCVEAGKELAEPMQRALAASEEALRSGISGAKNLATKPLDHQEVLKEGQVTLKRVLADIRKITRGSTKPQ